MCMAKLWATILGRRIHWISEFLITITISRGVYFSLSIKSEISIVHCPYFIQYFILYNYWIIKKWTIRLMDNQMSKVLIIKQIYLSDFAICVSWFRRRIITWDGYFFKRTTLRTIKAGICVCLDSSHIHQVSWLEGSHLLHLWRPTRK